MEVGSDLGSGRQLPAFPGQAFVALATYCAPIGSAWFRRVIACLRRERDWPKQWDIIIHGSQFAPAHGDVYAAS